MTHMLSRGGAPPLPPLPKDLPGTHFTGPRASAARAKAVDEVAEDDFTAEELRLEKDVDQALSELEAADAAITALRLQLENSTDDVNTTRRELSQLQGVTIDWESATDEGRRELKDRESRVEELLAALPAEFQHCIVNAEPKAGCGSGITAAPEADVGSSPRSIRRLDIATDRVRVLEGQTAKLEEQLITRQFAAETSMAERRKLEQQADALEKERESLRQVLRESRGELQEVEIRLKRRDEILVATAQKRQTLERQLAHLRAQVNGLNARLASLAAPKALTDASSTSTSITPAASAAVLPTVAASFAPAALYTGPSVECSAVPLALPGEDARAASLRLQREIVSLWEEIRRSDTAEMEAERG